MLLVGANNRTNQSKPSESKKIFLPLCKQLSIRPSREHKQVNMGCHRPLSLLVDAKTKQHQTRQLEVMTT